eukprot:gnl/MRDRNA2_/MRDRNA2_89743_c0_seq1.p1 gnl/MRDRNA2_/MRDRNA2_89743_c0~~gnl/MRDRNA2_/MRDRNA2_89743_c0_seq1.p1  ORF type:complete len:179 (+),score=69.14 gnl/MRDRNA2_/MRDRNA2_89743_c0_seq1:90-626(+)
MSLLSLFLVLLSPYALFAEEAEEEEAKAPVELKLFDEIGEDNYEAYLEKAKEGLFWVCFGAKPAAWKEEMEKKRPVFEALAKSEKWGKYPFVYLNMETPDQYEDSGCVKDKVTTVFQTGSLEDEEAPFFRKVMDTADEITEEVVSTFMQEVLDGKVEAVDTLDDEPDDAPVDMNDEEI